MNSIHGRVWRAAGLVTAIALLLAGGAAYFLIQDDLMDDLDQSLIDQAHLLAEQRVPITANGDGVREVATAEKGRGFLITDRLGAVLLHGGDPDLVRVVPPANDIPHSARTELDNEVRIVRLVLPADDGDDTTPTQLVNVTVSQDLDRIDRTLAGIAAALLVACLGVSALVAGLLGLAMRRAMRPVITLTDTIAGIDPTALPNAVAIAEVPVELQPILTQLNALLARLAATLAHERAFSAAAAHELRTPLSGLRATLEVALARERDAASLSASARACHAIVQQMESMVSGLLLLARTDAGRVVPDLHLIDLVTVTHAVWATMAESADQRGRTVDWSLPVQALVSSDPTLAGVMIRTLMDNALAHGSAEAPIRVVMTAAPSAPSAPSTPPTADIPTRWVLTVSNPGCRITEADVPKVFDRFWRGDQARSADAGHAGLGLAICRSAAKALGCSVRVGVADGWFTATVEFPGPTADGLTQASV